MPANRPRKHITLDYEVYDVIDQFAKAQGVTFSDVVNETFKGILPPLKSTLALLQAAAEAPQSVRDGLRQTLDNIEREVMGDYAKNSANLDWIAEKFSDSGEEIPPNTNRGV